MYMKKIIVFLAVSLLLITSCKNGDGVMTCKNGVYTINTTEIGKEIEGFNGATPLLITIEDNKISKIDILENEETPRFLERAEKGIFPALIGRTPHSLQYDEIDAVSGATYSSEALIANLRLGIKYYLEHRSVRP